MKSKLILALRLLAAAILLQTLYFKFTGAPESKFIFSTLGVEPWGRILSGVAELVASVLLLIPLTQVLGALIAMGVMAGAILSHIFILGFIIQDDGGLLFALACIVFLSSALIILLQPEKYKPLIKQARLILMKEKA